MYMLKGSSNKKRFHVCIMEVKHEEDLLLYYASTSTSKMRTTKSFRFIWTSKATCEHHKHAQPWRCHWCTWDYSNSKVKLDYGMDIFSWRLLRIIPINLMALTRWGPAVTACCYPKIIACYTRVSILVC